MKSLFDFIVEPYGQRYNNKVKVGDKSLIINTQVETFKAVNNIAKVIEVPLSYKTPVKKGDLIMIHHNVFRRYYDMRGNEKNSRNYFKEDKYLCFSDQIFLYKRGGKWYTPPGFCFVKPIKSINNLTEDKEEPLTGVLKHLGSNLRDFGLGNYDIIGFTPNSEYEFVIDNERLYRVPLNSISIKYERKGTEVEYNTSWV